MVKRGSGDNSGVSMLALIRQVLIDGKVHTIKQIADHMQQYMFKGLPPERVLENIKNLLDHHSQVEKTSKGYRLKGGSNLSHVVHDILAEQYMPISEKEIIKLVAQKQGVPEDMIRVELEDDPKIETVSYKSRNYYFLAGRKNVNEKIHKLLKNTNRALSLEEVFNALETEHKVNKDKGIFLPREDSRIIKSGSKYTLKKKTQKKAPVQPRHLVTKQELENVVTYLESHDESLTADELAKVVLDRNLEDTNLRFKLARDQRLKRDDNRFYFEREEEEKQIPVKIKDRIDKEFYKVKARMMGMTEVQSVTNLLDRVYGINLAHQEFGFYQRELEDHLMRDEESVLLLDNRWVHKSNEPRAKWVDPPEFRPLVLPDPPALLVEERLTEAERRFIDGVEKQVTGTSDRTIVFHVSPAHRKHGILSFADRVLRGLPRYPKAYELLVSVPEHDSAYEAFVLMEHRVIRGLESMYADHLPEEGGIVLLTPVEDNPYRAVCAFAPLPETVSLNSSRITLLSEKLNDTEMTLPELIRWIFEHSDNRFFSCYQLWAELTLIGAVTRRDLLATVKDYNCFLPIKSMDGSYSFDAKAGMGRLSVVPVSEKLPKPLQEEMAPVEPAEVEALPVEIEKEVATVAAGATSEAEDEDDGTGSGKARQKAKKDPVKKRKRLATESEEEELPEHILRLKSFEHKLPKLKTAKLQKKPEPVVPVPARKPVRIGPVSAGKPHRTTDVSHGTRLVTEEAKNVLLPIPPMPETPENWESTAFVNPDKGSGYAELLTTLEVLKTFVSRIPQVRRTDGSIVLFLDHNNLAIYFRIPPENQDCWLAWIPEESLQQVNDADVWLSSGAKRAKKSDNGYWWATGKFKGPKGNFRDKNVLEGVEIVGKLLELMEKENK
ncbi:hypothetical protein JXA80_04915 [bacterium]|nr:hypothetical protein [candidate division CSSED10-310 bacterium]